MKTKFIVTQIIQKSLIIILFFALFGCKKEQPREVRQLIKEVNSESKGKGTDKPTYNLEVVLRGEGYRNGHIHFRQEKDVAKIITLDTKVHHLRPNTEYLLQRAVDVELDGICTGTSWLTLGYGLEPKSILTDHLGNGDEALWRDVSTIASGSTFDIHFRIVDKSTMSVVLESDCYQYTVR